jgi:hypothetical protein
MTSLLTTCTRDKGSTHTYILGALQSKHCHLILQNISDKIEQYYCFWCDNLTEFQGLWTIRILLQMLQMELYVPAT